MKIALVQSNYTVGDLDGNKRRIIEAIAEAGRQGAELVVTAEYAVSGAPLYDLVHKASFLEACEDALREIASHCGGIAALVGTPIQEGNRVMSAAAYIHNGQIVKYIGKQNVLSRSELSFVSPSKGCEYIELGEHRIAVVVGDDVRAERAFGDDAAMIVAMQSDPFARGQVAARVEFGRDLAYTVAKPLVWVNQVGGQSDFVFDGSSFALNERGGLVALLESFEEDFRIIDTASWTEIPFPEQNRTVNTYRAIKLGLGDFFRKNGFTRACLGMSGGIDSAVVLALATEVLGPGNVRILMLPSPFSTAHSVDDSIEMADLLGVEYDVIPINEAYTAVNDSMIPVLGGTRFDVTEENIQSRLRCVMLMALSNKHGHILLNTSNKSEAAVGYGTLYGDSAGALGPIGDLYKIEVYSLARHINRNGIVIPENIILKEPSAELHPGQKDSDSLPPYEVMDAILYRFIEEGQLVDEIVGAGFDDHIVRRVLEMVRRAEFKRRQTAPPLRISQRPFASHFVLPLLSRFTF